jgi:hypothetical protein
MNGGDFLFCWVCDCLAAQETLWSLELIKVIDNSVFILRGSVVGWGTMLQAGTLSVRVPDKVDVFTLPNPSSCTMALGSTQPLTEISTRIFLGVKSGRRVGLTILPPSVNRMSKNVRTSTSHNPKGLHGLYRDSFTLYEFLLKLLLYYSCLVYLYEVFRQTKN